MLQPSEQWRWFIHQDNVLALDCEEGVFVTPYKKAYLVNAVFAEPLFNVDDAAVYDSVIEFLNAYQCFSAGQLVQIALNVCAVKRFYKPVLPKDWLFYDNPQGRFGYFAQMTTEAGSGRFLVVEQEGGFALCVLLDESLALNGQLTMAQFSVVKVSVSKLKALSVPQSLSLTA